MAVTAEDAVDATHSSALHAEFARRAGALARGERHAGDWLGLRSSVALRLEEAERHARDVARAGGGCDESRHNAALEFLATVASTLALDPHVPTGQARRVVSSAASEIGISRRAANLAVFQRALAAPHVAELPPPLAYESILTLVLELAPAEAVSLWTSAAPGRADCVASAGEAARSRRLRLAARVVLGAEDLRVALEGTYVRGVAVDRWDRPYAALVARGRPDASGRLGVYLAEAAAALSPFFERETLFERNSAREHSLVSASERRLTRLGCDLHDGPLQEIVALADDLRLARDQIASLLETGVAAQVRGRFDDLEARLASLDEGLRDLSQAIRSTGAADRPLELGLRTEVEKFNRIGTIAAHLWVEGDLSELTASQSIVCFRVVQEALSNARRHSGATRVRVRVRSTHRYVTITVADDGCGFDVDAAKRSGRLGLTGVIERVRLLGGDIEIDSAPGRGTRVRATLPRWSRAVGMSAVPAYAVTV